MSITRIKVENIKGASCLDIVQEIIPNKPSLMVAPNGFGKSSITAAFSSIKSSKLNVDRDHFHKGDDTLNPKLTIDVRREDGTIETFCADKTGNSISGKFDVFVINSRLEAKAVKRNMGGFTSASASLVINEVVLVDTIPEKCIHGYSASRFKGQFGANGKILPNLEEVICSHVLADIFIEKIDVISKISGVKNAAKLAAIIGRINGYNGNVEEVLGRIEVDLLPELEEIDFLKSVADFIASGFCETCTRVNAFLLAYQICRLQELDPKVFRKACLYNSYIGQRASYTELMDSFNTTWASVKPKEVKGRLIVEFPKALHISNGQRDSLCFAAMLQRAKRRLGKRDFILVIDEVFDYLDDANIIAVQYFISGFIDEVRGRGGRIYPLIFTHLNPLYFKNFAFSDVKFYFLDKRVPVVSESFKNLIINRGDLSIKAGIERHHLHYDPMAINLRAEFKALALKGSLNN